MSLQVPTSITSVLSEFISKYYYDYEYNYKDIILDFSNIILNYTGGRFYTFEDKDSLFEVLIFRRSDLSDNLNFMYNEFTSLTRGDIWVLVVDCLTCYEFKL